MTKVIKFESGSIKDEDKKIRIKYGDIFQFEFIQDKLTPVHLINTNSKIDHYINEMSDDHAIFVDFEFVPSYLVNKKDPPPPICVFTFTCSKGVYVFKQTNMKPNKQLKAFLSSESGHVFIGFSLRDSISRLKEMFGEDFTINIEDTLRERLKPNKISVIKQIFEKYGGDMLIKIKTSKMKQKYWNIKFLNFELFTFTATWSFVISHCYDKFPEKVDIIENDDENDDKEDDEEVKKPKKKKKQAENPNDVWKIGEKREIEFFPNEFTTVILLNSDRDLKKFIPIISESKIISIDCRFYSLDLERKHYISLFTFATSKNAYVFYKTTKEPNDKLKKFLSKESGLNFIGKDSRKIEKQLNRLYGPDFQINIKDIVTMIPKNTLKKLGKSTNKYNSERKNEDFYNIVTTFLGEPCERLHQFSDIKFNKYSSLSLNVKKTAMWSVIVFKIAEKLKSGNFEKVTQDVETNSKKPKSIPQKQENSDDEGFDDDDEVIFVDDYDDDDDVDVVEDDDSDDFDDNNGDDDD